NNTVMLGQGSNTLTLGTGSNNVTVGNENNTITIGGSTSSTETISAGNGQNTMTLGEGIYNVTVGNGGNTFILDGGTYNIDAGTGADTFIFTDPAGQLITDLGSNDVLEFRDSGFDFGSLEGTGTGTPQPLPFSTSGFTDASVRFAYDPGSGDLRYASDGLLADSTVVAALTNKPVLTAGELLFIS
ncbi:MAG: hypothetical protein ACM3JG_15455, partial [Thiohalocapsa sp.]